MVRIAANTPNAYRIAQSLERQLALAAPMPQIRDGHGAMLKVPIRGLVAGADRRVGTGARESDARRGERWVQRRCVADDRGRNAQRVVVAVCFVSW
jgi:hypothetical protein